MYLYGSIGAYEYVINEGTIIEITHVLLKIIGWTMKSYKCQIFNFGLMGSLRWIGSTLLMLFKIIVR